MDPFDVRRDVWVSMLHRLLDLPGIVHATAERLQLHRTTLYYRLQRVEQLAGTNLKDGNERLCLHTHLAPEDGAPGRGGLALSGSRSR